jgi:hypothetical protein
MLHVKVISSTALELLKSLQGKNYLSGFYLVGGSALALYYGHRHSIDIDLSTNMNFNAERLLEQVQYDYSYQLFFTAKNTLKGRINETNVDIIAHRYSYLRKPKEIDGMLDAGDWKLDISSFYLDPFKICHRAQKARKL